MTKLPDVFRLHFVKEGVVHAIDGLAGPQTAGAGALAAGAASAASTPPAAETPPARGMRTRSATRAVRCDCHQSASCQDVKRSSS